MKTIELKMHKAINPFWFVCALLLTVNLHAASQSDNFNDNAKDPSKWGADVVFGNGVLTERNGRVEYTCANPALEEDDAERLWKLTRFPYNADWEIQIDVFISAAPSTFVQVCSFGINLLTPDEGDNLYAEMYSSALGGGPARWGFSSGLETDDETLANPDSSSVDTTNGAVRMAFDSATKVIALYYDLNPNDGYQWIQYASLGIAGAGGTDINTDWHLNATDQFTAYIYGYSAHMVVAGGQMFGDNFSETGGVASSGGVTPVPTGNFHFGFPTGNPLLTAIANLSGNYTGFTPPLVPNDRSRNYSMDVAQDDSGKLTFMGTIDGIANASGGNEIGGSAGSVTTVNGMPSVRMQTAFVGTGDGIPANVKTTSTGRGEFIDTGGGSNAVPVTLDVSAKVAGIPVRLKNTPAMFPADATFESNLKRDWNINLDINRKTIKGKERIVASAQLQLPNGDTVSYPERAVRYSAAKGYSLAFKRGTNVTMVPNRIDKKSSVMLKRLTFVQQGADWQPTGGNITYQFLGQKGTANVIDFITP